MWFEISFGWTIPVSPFVGQLIFTILLLFMFVFGIEKWSLMSFSFGYIFISPQKIAFILSYKSVHIIARSGKYI